MLSSALGKHTKQKCILGQSTLLGHVVRQVESVQHNKPQSLAATSIESLKGNTDVADASSARHIIACHSMS